MNKEERRKILRCLGEKIWGAIPDDHVYTESGGYVHKDLSTLRYTLFDPQTNMAHAFMVEEVIRKMGFLEMEAYGRELWGLLIMSDEPTYFRFAHASPEQRTIAAARILECEE